MKRSSLSWIFAAFFFLALSGTAKGETFTAYLHSAQEVPTNASTATGFARVFVNPTTNAVTWTVFFTGLTSTQVGCHIHAPAAIGANAPIIVDLGTPGGTTGTITGSGTLTSTQLAQLRAGLGYINVHSSINTGGEIRGQLGKQRPVDYDGDGRQDLSVLRFPTISPPGVAPITYWNRRTTAGDQVVQWGNANTDFPAPGDYDGDGLGDLALYRSGATAGAQSVFLIFRSSDNTAFITSYGLNGDIVHARDYDGDGKTDPAVFRRGAAQGNPAVWWIRESTTNADRVEVFGTTGNIAGSSGDTPVSGDYDGDGKFDLAVYRFGGMVPNNHYIIKQSSDGAVIFRQWGNFTSDYILPGDYDGDGKYDLAAGRTGATSTSPMVWWIQQSSNGQTRVQQFGLTSDLPVQGDYDGDARADIAVYRRGATANANSIFWIHRSLDNTVQVSAWGLQADFPVATFDAR